MRMILDLSSKISRDFLDILRNAFHLKRLSLWESWREAPERAMTLIKNFERGDGSL